MSNNSYNGWANFATWRVNLECFDGWDIEDNWSHEEFRDEVINPNMKEACDKYDTIEERVAWFKLSMVSFMADYMKTYPDYLLHDGSGAEEIIKGWAQAFLDDVNWREIAETHLENDALFNQAISNLSEGATEVL